MNIYIIFDQLTGMTHGRASTPEQALARCDVLTEQFSWIDGRTFTYKLNVKE